MRIKQTVLKFGKSDSFRHSIRPRNSLNLKIYILRFGWTQQIGAYARNLMPGEVQTNIQKEARMLTHHVLYDPHAGSGRGTEAAHRLDKLLHLCGGVVFAELWEFYEFGMDRRFGMDMHRGTMMQPIHAHVD